MLVSKRQVGSSSPGDSAAASRICLVSNHKKTSAPLHTLVTTRSDFHAFFWLVPFTTASQHTTY